MGTLDQLPFLFGIPMSVKDLFNMRNCLSTVGVAFLNQKRTDNAVVLTPLLEAGAIPIIRGNIP